MKRWLWIPLAALAAVAPSAARADGPEQPQTAPSAGGRRMTIDECIAVAVQRNPDALSSELEVRAAEAARAGTMGEFGPKLRLEGNALQWNSPFDVVFAPPGTPGPTPPIRVRDAFSWIGTASLIQPITPIYAIY